MNKSLKYTLLVSIFLIGQSCTDLTEEIQDSFTERVETGGGGPGGGGAGDGLGAAYSRTFAGSANHGSYFSIQGISSDEMAVAQKGGDWFDGGIWLDMHRHTWLPTNDGIRNAWNDAYAGINECNQLLATENVIANANSVAQLRALRAYFYYRLLDSYGRVKIVTQPGVDAAQSTPQQLYDFIEAEVLAAIPELGTGRSNTRMNQWAAYSLLAKLYLNAEWYTGTPQWNNAMEAADQVINSGAYDLAASYSTVFSPTNTDNIEHIWVIPYDEVLGTGMNIAQMTLHYPSQLTFRLQQQPWNGYAALEEFYNSYEDVDERKENNFLVGPQLDTQGDPILDLSFEGSRDASGAAVVYTPEINELAPLALRDAGARLFKFNFKMDQLNDMDNDFPIFRYGDVLLMKAEAKARLNNNWNDEEVLMLVNMVRSRAGVAPFTAITADNFLTERGREMFMENYRRQDLIRFGAWGDPWWEKQAHSNPNLRFFPIPLESINAAASETFTLTQNPGY